MKLAEKIVIALRPTKNDRTLNIDKVEKVQEVLDYNIYKPIDECLDIICDSIMDDSFIRLPMSRELNDALKKLKSKLENMKDPK